MAALTGWRTAAGRGRREFDHESQRKEGPKMGLDPQDLEAIRALVREELAEHEQDSAAALKRMAEGYRDAEAARAAEES